MTLDTLAAKLGLVRSEDESDDAFRRRMKDILRQPSPVTRADFEFLVQRVAGRGSVAHCYISPRFKLVVSIKVPWWRRRERVRRRVLETLELERPANMLIGGIKVERR